MLGLATLALYSPAVRHPFIVEYDDDCYVLNNSHVQAGVLWKTVTWASTSYRCGNWHPITWLSHALDCALYGLNPHGHHFTSVLLHALNVMLLFVLLMWATGTLGKSLLVALLFATHPFNVESVVWIAERKNLLSMLWFLLALGAYGWYTRKPTVKRYGAVLVTFVLGLASKPMVITLPCVLLLLDFWPLRRIRGLKPLQVAGSANADEGAASPPFISCSSGFLFALGSGKVAAVCIICCFGRNYRSCTTFSQLQSRRSLQTSVRECNLFLRNVPLQGILAHATGRFLSPRLWDVSCLAIRSGNVMPVVRERLGLA